MFSTIAHRMIDQSERETGESADYLRDIYRAAPSAFWKFALFLPLSWHRRKLPPSALSVARIAAVRAEDCGPCLQIVVRYAGMQHVDPATVRQALEGNSSAMKECDRLAFLFATALVRLDPESETYRQEIEQRWGKTAVVDIALAIASSRVFPMLKRAMGYARSCQRVMIEGETMAVGKLAAAAE